MAERKEEVKSLLMKMREKNEKAGLKLNIEKAKIMVSSRITSGQIDGETMERVTDFIFLGSKITTDIDCSLEIKKTNKQTNKKNKQKRCLLLGRKAIANLDRLLKSRDITLPTKVHIGKAMVFPVVMHGCKSWTIKKAETEELVLLNCSVGEDS